MKYLQAIVLLCGVALVLGLAEPEDKPGVKPEVKPEVKKPEVSAVPSPKKTGNCDCQCDYFTWSSKGKIMGNCQR
jgi:hypothetical protein